MSRPKGSHNGKRNKIKRICLFCNNIFSVWHNRIQKGEGKFCSVKCHNDWQKLNPKTGHLSPRFNSYSKKCAICNKIMLVSPSISNKKFCSEKCQGKHYSTLTGEKSHNWQGKKISRSCSHCGKEIIIGLWRINTAKYCSYKCYAKYRPSGDKAGNWKGGLTTDIRQYKQFAEQKRRAMKVRASGDFSAQEFNSLKLKHNNKCLCCDKQEPYIKIVSDHIIPLSKGGANDITNIQPLCASCNSKKFTKIISYIPHRGTALSRNQKEVRRVQ